MMFCFQESVVISLKVCLDLGVDERDFEGVFVLEPKFGCYQGVVVIDGNSLWRGVRCQLKKPMMF